MTKLIGLTGTAGSGKSFCADYLVEKHGFVRLKFAGPLKAMTKALFRETLNEPAAVQRALVEGSLKEEMTKLGTTPRRIMQTLGGEWGRDILGEDFWVNCARWKLQYLLEGGQDVVIDDVRYDNEADLIQEFGGCIFQVLRFRYQATHGPVPAHEHVSEHGISAHLIDGNIDNTPNRSGPLADALDMLVEEMRT